MEITIVLELSTGLVVAINTSGFEDRFSCADTRIRKLLPVEM
jgi:hypothetical protein